MWKETHPRRREKLGAGKATVNKPPQATTEQLRIAQLVVDQNEDDVALSKNLSKIVEVTGVSEEKALLALYDSNDDPSTAIELLLEKQSMGDDTGWVTAGRRKNRGSNSATRATEKIDDDFRGECNDRTKTDKQTGKGRGRKGRVFDQTKVHDDKENENVQAGRRGGRGRSRSGQGRGRGRGPPRHSRNRVLGGKSDENSFPLDTALQEPVDMWKAPGAESWDIEVGTWTSRDVQKHQQTEKHVDAFSANWGTDSWTDDLSESQVYKAQNTGTIQSTSTTETDGVTESGANRNLEHEENMPQTGERIDIALLFQKAGTESNFGGIVNMSHGKANRSALANQTDPAEQVEDYQQCGQTCFGEPNSSTTSITSRMFMEYEQARHSSQPDALFQTDETSDVMKSSYQQINGGVTVHDQSKSSSTLLDSFDGMTSNTALKQQPNILEQFNSLTSTRSQMQPFPQNQMQRQTHAHFSRSEATVPNIENLKHRDEDHLSFGSPLPPQLNQHSRQQRKKIATVVSKIPASAVVMPGNQGYSSQDYSPFSLQFGADDQMSVTDVGSHDYGASIPRSISSGIIMPQQSGLFVNGENLPKASNIPLSSSNTDSLFAQTMQVSTKGELQKLEGGGSLPGILDHAIKAPPGLDMPSAGASGGHTILDTAVSSNDSSPGHHVSSFLQRSVPPDDKTTERSLDSSFHRVSSFSSSYSQEVSSYYVMSTSHHPNQSPNIQHGSNGAGQTSHSPTPQQLYAENLSKKKSMQLPSNNKDSLHGPNLEPSSQSSNMSSLTASLNQVSIMSSKDGKGTAQSDAITTLPTVASNTGPYSSLVPSPEIRSSSPSAPSNRNPGFNTVQGQACSSSYENTVQNTMQSITSSTLTSLNNVQQSRSATTTSDAVSSQVFKLATQTMPAAASGTLASAKMPPISNKGNMNVPSAGVAAPIQYGIPMAGLMPYATPDIPYGYDQLLLAQSRVVNPLNHFYDMHFHGNTQPAAVDGQDSSAQLNQSLTTHGKYNQNDASGSTPSGQLSLRGTVGSELSQHNSNISVQAVPPKVTQSTGHHTGQQQQQQPYMGAAMPAYANYSGLATPYYSLGVANAAGFQYPATMFAAAAMHQAPKHAVSTTDGFQQSTTRFSHTSAITSSSGLSDLSRHNYPKAHASGLDKQQGFHHHTNTPPPFNLQTITAAVAAGSAAASGSAAPGMGPYAGPPYMTLLQPHHASQPQTMHLLQHQDSNAGHSIGSQRALASTAAAKSTGKRSGYGSAASSSYWGT